MWIALFSQTGSEIRHLSDYLNRYPDIVYTSNANVDDWNRNIPETLVRILKPVEINKQLVQYTTREVVTLHGYLRIIPGDVLTNIRVYNGHPGDVVQYPELKGKDPQEKVWRNLSHYKEIGSIVHRVTPEVDSGEVITRCVVKNNCITREDVYNTLKQTSLNAWKQFFRQESSV